MTETSNQVVDMVLEFVWVLGCSHHQTFKLIHMLKLRWAQPGLILSQSSKHIGLATP